MFYKKGIDITNARQMFEFLNDHYTYDTLNSWNKLESIAHNVKLYNLQLDGDWSTALDYIFDSNDIGGLQFEINHRIADWEADHPGYSLGFNGRSCGYLVMYNKTEDGRVNFKNVIPDSLLDADGYKAWKQSIKESWYHERVKDFIPLLRKYTKLVQDFDKFCDELRDLVNEYSKRDFKADKKAFEIGDEA